MKILFYIHSLCIGGAETMVTNQLVEIDRTGVNVCLVVNEMSGTFLEKKLIANNIRVVPLFRKKTHLLISAIHKILPSIINRFLWKRILMTEAPDLIHINTTTDYIYGIKYPSNKFVFTFHSDVRRYFSIHSKRSIKQLRDMANKGSSFFAITNVIADQINNILKTNNIRIVHNSVDIDKIRKESYKKDFLLSIGVPESSFIVGHVGRFHPVKNHEKVVEVFNEIHKLREDSYLLLVGGDCEGRMDALKETIKNYGLTKYVLFLGIRDDATKIMGCFDALVLPSYSESFSLVLVEAQALGVRCVASTNIPEEVVCNKNCFRLSLDEPSNQWASLLIGKDESNTKKDIKRFDNKIIINQMIKEYEKLIDKN